MLAKPRGVKPSKRMSWHPLACLKPFPFLDHATMAEVLEMEHLETLDRNAKQGRRLQGLRRKIYDVKYKAVPPPLSTEGGS